MSSISGCASTSALTHYESMMRGVIDLRDVLFCLPKEPLDKSKIPNLKNMDPDITKSVALHDPGNAHSMPYMWWTTGAAYDTAKIQANHTYAVQARIEVGGKLRFVSDQRYAVITRGAPAKVDILLKGVSNQTPR